MDWHLACPEGNNPFLKTNLSGVNVDGVEVGRHQSPQHEEEANEASTTEQETREVTKGNVEGLLWPWSSALYTLTHPQTTRSWGGAPPQPAWLWGPTVNTWLKPSIRLPTFSTPQHVPFQPARPLQISTSSATTTPPKKVCRISDIYYRWGQSRVAN